MVTPDGHAPRREPEGAKSWAGRPDTTNDTSSQRQANDGRLFDPPERPWTPDPGSRATRRHGLAQGRRRRDDGARAARSNTWAPWKQKAEDELRRLARTGRTFTSDDLIDAVGLPVASSRNAVGGLVQAAMRRGEIEPVGYTQSTRQSAHGRVIRVWQGVEPGR